MSETVKVKQNAISHFRRFDELGRLRPSGMGSGDTVLTKQDVKILHNVKCAQSRADALRQMETVKRRTAALDVAKKCVEDEGREAFSVVDRVLNSERDQRAASRGRRISHIAEKEVELLFPEEFVSAVDANIQSKMNVAKGKLSRPKKEGNRSKTPLMKLRNRSTPNKVPMKEERRSYSRDVAAREYPRHATVTSPTRGEAATGRSRTPKKLFRRTRPSKSKYVEDPQQDFVPVSLVDWRQKPDGTISGIIGHTGERVRTSFIVSGVVSSGYMVEDRDGKTYFLS